MNLRHTICGKKLITADELLCGCIAFYYAIQVLNRVQLMLMLSSATLALLLRFGTYCCVVFILMGLICNKANLVGFAVLEILVVLLFLQSLVAGNLSSLDWKTVYKRIATTFIPLAMAAYNIRDRQKLIRFIYPVAVASIPILIGAVKLSYGRWQSSYDMSLGYVMVFSCLILLAQFSLNKKIHNLILAVILICYILFIGSRGPIICVIGFGLIELLLSNQLSKKERVGLIFAFSAILSFIWAFSDTLLETIYRVSQYFGFESRTLFFLVQGAVDYDSGRSALYSYYMNLIGQKPLLGYGVMGAWIEDGMYPHNIVIELVLAFGYPLGILLLACLIGLSVSAIRRKSDRFDNALVVIFVSFCLYLMVSNSYLNTWQFFICLALCLPNRRISQQEVRESEKIRRSMTWIRIGNNLRI